MSEPFVERWAESLGPGARWSGVVPGALGWALGRQRGSMLVVAPTEADTDQLRRSIQFHGGRALPFPADDTRPYEGFSPHPRIPRQRVVTLDAIDRGASALVLASATALAHKVLDPDTLAAHCRTLEVGQRVDRDELLRWLVTRGYLVVPQVDDEATVAVRGDNVVVWPVGGSEAVRVGFFDDEIEKLRGGSLRLLPAREAIADPTAIHRAADHTARRVDQLGTAHGLRRHVLEELREGLWFPAAEDYLPALHALVPLSARFERVLVVEPERCRELADDWCTRARERHHALPVDRRPLIDPAERYATLDTETLTRAALVGGLVIGGERVEVEGVSAVQAEGGTLERPVRRLREAAQDHWRVALVADGPSEAERVHALLEPHGLVLSPRAAGAFAEGSVALWEGDLPSGFLAEPSRVLVLTAHELFGAPARPRPVPARRLKEAVLGSFTELKQGDLVVHVRHGIGEFEGLSRMVIEGTTPQDFVGIRYRDGAKLFLPVTRLELLSRYRAIGDHRPELDKLGGQTWERRKAKVRDRVLRMAGELLALHARRALVEGRAYEGQPELYQLFAESFPYLETPDQEAAIQDVLGDLAKTEPMDRLIVGDVGFGKTEVALRAAMRVVADGRQVLVLCPTTVLVHQHGLSFTRRFEGTAVTVDTVSRLHAGPRNKAALERLASGQTDILVGTTALLGRDARPKDLGLVVIDEEHRFGVKQKERLKQRFPDVDVLAMSATPIPRSLHMALSGIRPVSVIATPPTERLSVRTRVARFDPAEIRADITRELSRGGQVFVVHNRVQSIQGLTRWLERLVPEASFVVAHGQMDGPTLERALVRFVERDAQVLVSTAIVESGVDIPNVNTMLVSRADRMGLAQLHQLRGRVGRGSQRAYCTLLVPSQGKLGRDATHRLQVLEEHQSLGAGFHIATADLELRGSGNLLGEAQHGHIEAVGLDTYIELLESAVASAKGEAHQERIDPEIEVPVVALLPDDYVPEVDQRLHEYRKLALQNDLAGVRRVVDGWEDSYGPLPPEARDLGWLAQLKIRCRNIGIRRLDFHRVRATLEFVNTPTLSPEALVRMVEADPQRFQVEAAPDKPTRLVVRFTPDEATHPLRFLHWVFERLDQDGAS